MPLSNPIIANTKFKKPGFCDNLRIITQIQEETRFLSPHPSPPIQLIVNRHQLPLIVVNTEVEEIVQWIN